MDGLTLRPAQDCRWDCVALGEVMLRLEPQVGRVRNARSFQVWEGGGEYNLARALHKVFGLRSTLVSALPNNDLGWLTEDLIGQGGVDASHLVWRDFDGIGAATRVGLNFTERGFGVRPSLGISDRANSAASQMRPGEVDWPGLFGDEGVRWLHTGGVFAALSETTAELVLEAVQAAKAHGVIVSYDLNFRPSLWQSRGGRPAAQALNRQIAPYIDVLIGGGLSDEADAPGAQAHEAAMQRAVSDFPNLKLLASPLRKVLSANRNDWGALVYAGGKTYHATERPGLEIYDRVGGGDGFAAGLVYALMSGKGPQAAVDYGAALGALAMTTPGDSAMVRAAEVEALMAGGDAKVVR